MQTKTIVDADALEKVYGAGLTTLLLGRSRARGHAALADVSIRLEAGASLAILGRNGAGKSTLLRLLAGTAQPTRGTVRVDGRVGLLLDLGAGLVEEMSGEENAAASLRLTGVAPAVMAEALRFVREFAEIGEFFGQPVRMYSQGMRLRLAYAAAIASHPDVLITDEVLAVGDEAFQRRCSRHMLDFVGGGGTLVLATHNLYLAEKLCESAIWLEGGRVREAGDCGRVAKAYRDSLAPGWSAVAGGRRDPGPAGRSPAVGFRVRAGGTESGPGRAEPFRLRFDEAWKIAVPEAHGTGARWIELDRPDGAVVSRVPVEPRSGWLSVGAGVLLPGSYRLRLVGSGQGEEHGEIRLECVGARRELGSVLLAHRWGGGPAVAASREPA